MHGRIPLFLLVRFQLYLLSCISSFDLGDLIEKRSHLNGDGKMPDWLAHTMIGWITGKTIKMEVGLVVVGSILPDLVKINHVALLLGADLQSFFNPFHTPAVSLLVAGILALFFLDTKKVFFAFVIGIATHFLLDFFLIGATRGIQFLFPFSWEYWRFNEIMVDYRFTVIVCLAALVLYLCYFYYGSKKMRKKQEI
jgi:membrane-bound metal-dependent hydrolase YbcI (DUF457 family)